MGQMWIMAVVLGAMSYPVTCKIKENEKIKKYIFFLIPVIWYLSRENQADIANQLYFKNIIASFMILIIFECTPILQKCFTCHKLSGLKRISYSLFVVHWITYPLAITLLNSFILKNNNIVFAFWIVFIIKASIDFTLASCIHFIGEKRVMHWLKNINANSPIRAILFATEKATRTNK